MAVDFHSHILPRMDDGSDSVEMSLQMLRYEAEQGIDSVVLTPHFYPSRDDPQSFLERRRVSYERLVVGVSGEPGLPGLHLGAEVYFFHGMSDNERLRDLAIEGTSCILVEMPFSTWSDSVYGELEGIHTKQGLTPIVAHVERYLAPFKTRKVLDALSGLPLLIQANAGYFTSRSTSKTAIKLFEAGYIDLLGSDCHNVSDRRPNLGNALEHIVQRMGQGALDNLFALEKELLGSA